MLKLVFTDGKYLLKGDLQSVREEIGFDCNWLDSSKDLNYYTTSIRVAKRFRKYADVKTEKIFNRAFVNFYSNIAITSLPSYLDPHQKEGVRWILTRSRSYLAHAPGAGKTCEAITASLLGQGSGQTVFIVPPGLTLNWAREIDLWAGRLKGEGIPRPGVSIIRESARQDEVNWEAPFIIVPDSMLAKPWVLKKLTALPISFIAVDEASRFKEAGAERTRALFGGPLKNGMHSPGLVYKPRYAVLLDGSPMPNRPMELWAPTYAMSPESIEFMPQRDFGFKYCGARLNSFGRWEFKHSTNEYELRRRLTETFMHVVPEWKLSHPERKRSILFMDKDVRTLSMKTWEKENLKKIRLKDLGEELNRGDIASHRVALGLRKVPWIARYVSDRISTKNESLLLFAWHRDVCLALEEALSEFHPGVVMGGTSDKDRERFFTRFQAGKLKLIIGNLAAMGRGHNLQRADRIVFGEYSWCGETNTQAEKRASRKGSEKEFVRCDYIVCPDSMDEIVLNSVFQKDSRVKKVIG